MLCVALAVNSTISPIFSVWSSYPSTCALTLFTPLCTYKFILELASYVTLVTESFTASYTSDEYMYVTINSSAVFLAHWIFPFTALLFTVIVIFPVVLSYDQLFLEKLSPFTSPFVASVEFATTVTVSGYLLLIFGAVTSMLVFFIGNTLFSTYDVILPWVISLLTLFAEYGMYFVIS